MRIFHESGLDRQSLYHRMLIAALLVLVQDLSLRGGAHAWTYTYSTSPNRKWADARQWCQDRFMEMVTGQNQEELDLLNNLLPFNDRYYWIGVHKVAGAWTRAGDGTAVPDHAQNWAPGEPINITGQDCVEVYIKRDEDATKWNNERCRSKKGTVCYSASCIQQPCGAHGDCVEAVGNYSCRCRAGFTGSRCDEAISCDPLAPPARGLFSCSDPHGSNRFSSSCRFSCDRGFALVGPARLLCRASGYWSHPVPVCRAEQCPALNLTGGGRLNCSHPVAPYGYNSSCELRCHEGYELVGQRRVVCGRAGRWTAGVPACTMVRCTALAAPPSASMRCRHPLGTNSYGSACIVQCGEGFDLIGTNVTKCSSGGGWSHALPVCQARRCPALNSSAHGSLRCSHPRGLFGFGSLCSSRCEDGFLPVGTVTTECTSLGTWSADVPRCLARRCPSINSASHGSTVCSNPHAEFSFGSRCTSGCDEGFVLNGTADTECTSSGMWSQEIPPCLAHVCPLLVAPEHGRINCRHPHSPFSFGSHCGFRCNGGFSLGGPPAVTCTSSGLWSRDAPTCQPVQCEPIAASSSLLSANCSHPLGNFSFGSRCSFTCEDGVSLNGTVLLCTSSGRWNGSLPTCTAGPVGAAALLYTGAGAAAGVIPLILMGLALSIFIRRQRKGNKIISDVPVWDANENPVFEF